MGWLVGRMGWLVGWMGWLVGWMGWLVGGWLGLEWLVAWLNGWRCTGSSTPCLAFCLPSQASPSSPSTSLGISLHVLPIAAHQPTNQPTKTNQPTNQPANKPTHQPLTNLSITGGWSSLLLNLLGNWLVAWLVGLVDAFGGGALMIGWQPTNQPTNEPTNQPTDSWVASTWSVAGL
jgi:hypothetical protein